MRAYVGDKRRATPKKRVEREEAIPTEEPLVLARKRTPSKKRATVNRRAAPKKRAATPKKRATVKRRAAPKKRAAAPKKRATVNRRAAPKKRAAAPKKRAAAPKKRAAVKRRAAPKKRAAAPKKRAAAPKKRAAAPRKRVPAKKTAARAGKRRRTGEKAEVLSKQLERERGKLRTKKVRLNRIKLARQRAKVSSIKDRLGAVVAPAPSKKVDKAERAAHYGEVFGELLRLARESRQLPKTDFRKRKVDSEDRRGEQRAVRTNVMLDEQGVEEALYQIERAAEQLPGNRYFWLCNFELCGMGDRLIGYGNRILKANHPDAHNFQIAFESSGVASSKARMLVLARAALEDYAGELYTLVMLLNVRVLNFSFKER